MNNTLVSSIIGRESSLFEFDLSSNLDEITDSFRGSRVLVVGGAGTIGQAVSRDIFQRSPSALHVVDISENNLVELVRDIRSSKGGKKVELITLPIDVNSRMFDAFIDAQKSYDYIFNLSALKHVRSEKDPYTLLRMVEVNIFNAIKLSKIASAQRVKKYFCVSTDKAANPVNLMGGSKRIMEKFLARESRSSAISMARFANVAFSDGSLLYGFVQRLNKRQPLAVPNDIKRFFISPKESGELCVMSATLGENLEIFFPKEGEHLGLIALLDIAIRFLELNNFEPVFFIDECEAKNSMQTLPGRGKWPIFIFESDTTGEKYAEEFFMIGEVLNTNKFSTVGIVKASRHVDLDALDMFEKFFRKYILKGGPWEKTAIVHEFLAVLPELNHEEKGRYLDEKM